MNKKIMMLFVVNIFGLQGASYTWKDIGNLVYGMTEKEVIDKEKTSIYEQTLTNEQIPLLFGLALHDHNTDHVITHQSLQTLRDIEVFTSDTKSAFNAIAQTKTMIGKLVFADILLHPITDITELQRRQEGMALLKNNEIARKKIQKGLQLIKEGEKQLATYINASYLIDQMPAELKNNIVFKAITGLSVWLSTSPNVHMVGTSFILTVAGAGMGYMYAPFIKDMYSCGSKFHQGTIQVSDSIKFAKQHWLDLAGLYVSYKTYQWMSVINKREYKKLYSMAQVVQGMKLINDTLQEYPELARYFVQSYKLQAAFAKEPSVYASRDYRRLLGYLLTDTFKDETLPFIHNSGRVGTVSILLSKTAKEFAHALHAIGEIDAWYTAASLLDHAEDDNHVYSYAHYVSNAQMPMIKVQGMWNSLVDKNKVVSNDITLASETSLNAIITGPNAGGKSTFLKGLTLNIVLGQTFGVVPAAYMQFTPFTLITTYLNVTDATAQGKSLFVAEVERVQALLHEVKQLQKHEFSFSIMDEIFTGTAIHEGEAASYAIARNLVDYTNSVFLLATHFYKLPLLEKETSKVTNYKFEVLELPDGSLHYPYLLKKGVVHQNVAFKILKDKGVDSDIITHAQAILHA